jgi:hypothetical protein
MHPEDLIAESRNARMSSMLWLWLAQEACQSAQQEREKRRVRCHTAAESTSLSDGRSQRPAPSAIPRSRRLRRTSQTLRATSRQLREEAFRLRQR